MSFFEIKLQVRVTQNTKTMVDELVQKLPDKFGDASDVLRVAILQLHRRELPKSKIKQEFKTKEAKEW